MYMSSQKRMYKATVDNKYRVRSEGWEHAFFGLLDLGRVKSDQQGLHHMQTLVKGRYVDQRRSSTLCVASYTDNTCMFA